MLSSKPARRAFRGQLLAWFDDHQRALPWRHVDDAYAVWVSEIMLQQTRVSTVVEYFERWMEVFPTLEALSQAPVEEVLELWSGLGYYRRARYLHRAAKRVVEEHDGSVPRTVEELKKLPGVGPYTAGAIASIAYGQIEPLVDGNVMRVISRLYTIGGDPKRAPAKKMIWQRAGELVDRRRPGDFNQAVMELGSVICTAPAPRCSDCPVSRWCGGLASGEPERFPENGRSVAQRPMRARSCVVYTTDEGTRRFLLRRRPKQGLLGGLWEFPSSEREGKTWPVIADLARQLEPGLGVDAQAIELDRCMGTVEHVFSHRRLRMRVHELSVEKIEPEPLEVNDDRWRWVEEDKLHQVASAALLEKVERLWRTHR